jgi:hypothetical protein
MKPVIANPVRTALLLRLPIVDCFKPGGDYER